MAQNIIRNEDFKSGSSFNNIRGIIYQGNGSPVNRVNSSNAGAIYIDNYTGQLWVSLNSGQPATWQPYFTDISTSVKVDSDVQEGDLVGIFGAGSWSTSGSLSTVKCFIAGAGSQNAAFVAGGDLTSGGGSFTSVSELFNGSTWTTSGNLSTSKDGMSGAGSINAALIVGGTTFAARTNLTELFNGANWSTSGVLSVAKVNMAAGGTQNAAFVAGGLTSGTTNVTELFNGSVWTTSGNLSTSKNAPAGAGSQNAAFVAGAGFIASELFNGSSWYISGNSLITRSFAAASGSQNSGLVAGGQTISATFVTAASELFNGSTWSATGALSRARRGLIAAGTQNAGLAAGGTTFSAPLSLTELHNQSIYRKLTYSSAQSAVNIGMAYNTSNTSLTASVMRGDLPSTYVTPNTWFGVSRYNNVDNQSFVSSNTATISSITTVDTNQATLNLSTALTTGFAIGSLLLISDGTRVPIIGGTVSAPIVRWENVSSSASTSLTVGCIWGQRITFSAMNITSSATTATVTQTATLQYSQIYKGRVGDLLMIPYSNPSGANGSSIYYGSYQITNVTYPATDIVAYTITLPTAINGSDTNIGGITLLQQLVCNTNALSAEDVILGYRNKMRTPMYPVQDDLSNGLI